MKKQKYLYILFLIILQFKLISNPNIDVDFKASNQYISPYLFGGFIEYYFCFSNGNNGIWAQEFNNRGFDYYLQGYSAIGWDRWQSTTFNNVLWESLEGGYNENGQYYEKMSKSSDTGSIGLGQFIYTTDDTGYDFYIYAKSEKPNLKLKLKVLDYRRQNILFDTILGNTTLNWEKYSSKIPNLKNQKKVFILIYFDQTGSVCIDEASIMPSNNINGFRKVIYDYYKDLGQTILRYPGGWFIEYSGYNWEMGLGPIDKRKIYKGKENIRLDFGIDEYIRFCKSLKMEPHLVVNYLTGSPEQAANILSYCNSDTSSKYGKLRFLNGNEKPYNVKFWEIGNEIWFEPLKYAKDYLKFYDTMKLIDPSIKCIMSGDVWHDKSFFDSHLSVVGDKCDIWGWHWTQDLLTRNKPDNRTVFLSAVGGSQFTDNVIDLVNQWGTGYNLKIQQAITELWTNYNPDKYDWVADTTIRAGSLENALWTAAQLHSVIRNSDKVNICEKTNSMALIRNFVDPINDNRVFYVTPTYYAIKMLKHHYGDTLVNIKLNDCETFSTDEYPGLFTINNMPWIDAIATKSKDTLYISVINKNPDSDIIVDFKLDNYFLNTKINIYELSSNSYLDNNSPYDNDNFTIHEYKIKWTNKFQFKKHSFTILAFPISDINYINDQNEYGFVNYSQSKKMIFINTKLNINRIELIDINGEIIEEFNNINDSTYNINTYNYPLGVYFIRINTGNNLFYYKTLIY